MESEGEKEEEEEEENKELKSISAKEGMALRKQAKWTDKLSRGEG